MLNGGQVLVAEVRQGVDGAGIAGFLASRSVPLGFVCSGGAVIAGPVGAVRG